MFLIYMVLFALAIGAGVLLRLATNRESVGGWFMENWPMTIIIIVGGAALLSIIERSRWTLRVLDGRRLEGPTGAFGERSVMPAEQIDWEKSKRSLGSRVKIGNAIYGRDGRRIVVNQWFFDPEKFQTILDMISPRIKN